MVPSTHSKRCCMLSLPVSRYNAILIALIAFHIFIVIASNYLVQFPMHLFGWKTTWGAFSFPFIFLATDLTVRLIGKHRSEERRVGKECRSGWSACQ